MDFTFHGIPAKFLNANSNLKDEQYGGEKLCMYQAYDHTHTHIETHTHEHNNNPISIVHLFFQTMHAWHEFKNTPSIPKY